MKKFLRGFVVLFHIYSKQNCSSVVRWTSGTSAAVPLRTKKEKSSIERKRHFIDSCQVTTVGGKGGDGCIAFLQLFRNPLAGPSGGDGGNGGHVIFEVNPAVKSLCDVPSVVRAENGENGMGKHMHGASGKHSFIEVPLGTVVKNNNTTVADLNNPGEKFIASRGGAGGHGNHFFLSNKNRHPEVAEIGADGEVNRYSLELKIMAHVGLVGFPNAGKSTFLQAISRAKPKIASYPFTTLKPNIGVVLYDDYEQIAVADLPGIIPDAHKNRGLGISFLRHIERCVCILYVIDLSENNPAEQLRCLQYELEQYEENLSKRPFAIVGNKYDLPEAQENLQSLKSSTELPVYPVSAKTGYNIRTLLDFMRHMYDKHSKEIFSW